MRWVRFDAGRGAQWGIASETVVEEVEGTPLAGQANWRRTGRMLPWDALRLLAPIEAGSLFAPAQPNYRSHLQEHAKTYGDRPALDFNYRGLNSVAADGEPIVIPKGATQDVVFEGELAVVIGRRASAISEEDAASVILGFTIANDVTDRGWQATDRTVWRAKNADSFCPLGPWIETDFDLEQAVTTVALNGKPVVEFRTGDLIFSIPHMLARLTRYVTLRPGDVLLCGTDEPTLRIAPGDTVAVGISGIGSLRNPVST